MQAIKVQAWGLHEMKEVNAWGNENKNKLYVM